LDVQLDDLQAYCSLKETFKSGKLTEQERETLIQLNELIEIAHAKRMGYVIELAKLRHISLEKAMSDLGIKHLTA
jgi:soluble P-type ATPase